MAPSLRLGEWSGGVLERRAALLDFCARELDVARARLALAHDHLGAPILRIDGVSGRWRISSSSRENLCLFGLAEAPIGVDMEICSAIEPAWNVLCAEERAAVKNFQPERQAEEFLRLWTAKEAYLKALGVGLRREPREIHIRPEGGSFGIIDREQQVTLREARFWREKIGAREALCACVVMA